MSGKLYQFRITKLVTDIFVTAPEIQVYQHTLYCTGDRHSRFSTSRSGTASM